MSQATSQDLLKAIKKDRQVLVEINVKNVPLDRLRFMITEALDELERKKADWVD